MVIVMIVTAEVTARSFVNGFATFAAKKGHEVYVIADGLAPLRKPYGRGFLTQVPVSMQRDPSPLKDFSSLINLRRTLKSIRPDLVTYATPKAALLGSLASWSLRTPKRVYQLWGLRLETSSGFGLQVLTIFEKLTSTFSSAILANSESLSREYERLGLNSNKPVDVVGFGSSHGVDLERFSSQAELTEIGKDLVQRVRQDSPQIILGFVGRIHKDKGVDTLSEAIEILASRNFQLKILIVGKDEGADSSLSDGIKDSVIKVGYVTDPRPYYALMDVLILPSRREGFPNVVLEAASMCVPAVASNATGVVDSVLDEVTGLIFEVGDAESLANAIQKLILNPDLVAKFGLAARQRVEENFSQSDVWAKTLDYLQS